MPRVFKKIIVRYRTTEGKRVPKGALGARKVTEKSSKWYGRPPGATAPVPLSRDKNEAELMLATLVRKAELTRVGLERDLVRILEAWPHLPSFIRLGILALVDAAESPIQPPS